MRVSRHKPTRNFETRLVHKNGALIALTWNGTWSEGTREHFLIGRDMTERKAVQEALLDSERIAEGIIAHSLDAIVQLNEWGEVIEWNPQAETMLGWTRDEAVGQPITDLYLPRGYRAALSRDERAVLRRRAADHRRRFEFEARCKDGRNDQGGSVDDRRAPARRQCVQPVHARHHRRSSPPKSSCGSRRRWRRSASSPAASRTTSTTCSPSSPARSRSWPTRVADRPRACRDRPADRRGRRARRRADPASCSPSRASSRCSRATTDVNTLVVERARNCCSRRSARTSRSSCELSERAWPALVDAGAADHRAAQSRGQRARRDAGRRQAHARDRQRRARRGLCQRNGDVQPGRLCDDRGQRHRQRHARERCSTRSSSRSSPPRRSARAPGSA